MDFETPRRKRRREMTTIDMQAEGGRRLLERTTPPRRSASFPQSGCPGDGDSRHGAALVGARMRGDFQLLDYGL
jgi:hypothetical protein